MFDEFGKLWSYQLLNPEGTKMYPKGAGTEGLFHKLQEPFNGQPIGIAESYATSATCFELSQVPMVCAFSSENLLAVTDLPEFLKQVSTTSL
jgi:putative DNA primase/helicase